MSNINQLWDKFWSGGIANPLMAIEQMSYLIFMKRLEDLDNVESKRAAARKQKHKSIFKGNDDCRFSEWKHYNAQQMMEHVKDKVFPFIKNIRNGEKTLFSHHMQDAAFLIPKPSLLQEAVAIIDDLNITAQNRDTQGDIYEYLLSELKTAGKNGQFRTPRHIIRMIVSLVNPDIGDKIADPACGTAGFLINAYEHILKRYTSPDIVKTDETGELHNLVGDKIVEKKHWKIMWEDTFFGYDFDTTMIRISLMNMVLHGIKMPKIDYMDTLSKRYEEREKYDVILANPPFKGSIDKNDINDNLSLKTTKTELLFVEQMINLLVTGGRCGVIVPEGVVFGNSNAHKNLRKQILETCQLDAVVSMPSGVFKPYAIVSTAVLIFTKGSKTDKVWFYDMEKDGYSLDDKRMFIDGKGDIPDIIERFEKRFEEKYKDRKGNCFFVPYREIKEKKYSLSFSNYAEIELEDIKYESPSKILKQIEALENKMKSNSIDLRRLTAGFLKLLNDKNSTKNLEVKPLSEACIINPKKSEINNLELDEKVTFLAMADVGEDGEIFSKETKRLKEVIKGFTYFRKNDVLFAKITPCMENGKGAIAKIDTDIGFGSTEFHVLRPKKGVTPEWIYCLLSIKSVRNMAEKSMTGSAGQKRVPVSFFEKFKVPIPPINVQKEFVKMVNKARGLKEFHKESDSKIDDLFGSLMQKAILNAMVA